MPLNQRRTKTNGANTATETRSEGSATAIQGRVDGVDWTKVYTDLDAQGWAVVPKLLSHEEADSIAGLYHQEQGFAEPGDHGRHGFGRGEYKYFSYPLPPLIEALRMAPYPHLAPIANQWHERMGKEVRFPHDHAAFLDAAIKRVRSVRRRCSSGMLRRTITVSIATSMGSMSSRFRSRYCWISQARTSRAASS